MVSLTALWMPIVLSAVLVFIASSIVHMLLPHHQSDWKKVPDEDGLMEAMRRFSLPPGDYALPCPRGGAEMKTEAYQTKVKQGPVVFMTVFPTGMGVGMGKQLAQWFVYTLVVSVFAAYMASRAPLADGAGYLAVFRITSTTAFAAYTLALWQRSIWYRTAWTTTLKSSLDGLGYALLTGGAFGWLWP
ncbi:MAG: hypothetical protein R2909_01595 [Gemmatimonadales bacterium]